MGAKDPTSVSPAGDNQRASRFQSIDAELARAEPPEGWLALLSRLRAVAAEPGAPAWMRLRFAERWHEASPEARKLSDARAENDRCSYLWSVEAAHRGYPLGQLLVAHCYRRGAGAPRDQGRARGWYRNAAKAGSSPAHFWLRATTPESARPWHRLLLYRGRWLTWIGLGLLLLHLCVVGWTWSWGALLSYFAVMAGGQLGILWLLRRGKADADAIVPDQWAVSQTVADMARRPWTVLEVAGEDGLVIVPLAAIAAVLGWPLLVAPVAGFVFGALHYPSFSARSCLTKGLLYAIAVAIILPWGGLPTLVAAHVLFDGLLLLLFMTSK